MKCVFQDPRTSQFLSDWAAGIKLEMPIFSFYHLGSKLQKSQEGMLRAILFSVLDRHRYLIPSIFQEVYRKLATNEAFSVPDQTAFELRRAFRRLLESVSTSLRLCIFIDGVDEYEGDFAELLEVLTSVKTSACTKVLLSSRPTTLCDTAFSQHPKLYLEDLTHEDIHAYVSEQLGNYAKMQELEELHGVARDALVDMVAERSSGVFLWVVLVVQTLRIGLDGGDNVADMTKRLETLPRDLSELYKEMLPTDPLEKEQASKLLQLLLLSIEIQPESPLSMLQLSFAEESSLQSACKANIDPETIRKITLRCDAMAARLRSRCRGLMEAQRISGIALASYGITIPFVGFFHKTVAEFIRSDEIGSSILSWTGGTTFDPFVSLASSLLHESKALPVEKCFPRAASNLSAAFTYLRIRERRSETEFWNAFRLTMNTKWAVVEHPTAPSGYLAWTHIMGLRLDWQWEKWERCQTDCTAFSIVALLHHNIEYFLEHWRLRSSCPHTSDRNNFCLQVFEHCVEAEILSTDEMVQVFDRLLCYEPFWQLFVRESRSHDTPRSRRNTWSCILAHITWRRVQGSYTVQARDRRLLDVLLRLLQEGEDPNFVTRCRGPSIPFKKAQYQTALSVIQNMYETIRVGDPHVEWVPPQWKLLVDQLEAKGGRNESWEGPNHVDGLSSRLCDHDEIGSGMADEYEAQKSPRKSVSFLSRLRRR
jgi:hypothetical protein